MPPLYFKKNKNEATVGGVGILRRVDKSLSFTFPNGYKIVRRLWNNLAVWGTGHVSWLEW
jgi:hypothetical protein